MISRAHIRHKLENIQNLVPLGSVSRPGIDVAVGLTPEGGEGDGGDDELHEGKEDASVSVASILFEIKFITHLEGSGVVDLSEEREKGFSLHSSRADAIRNSGKEEKTHLPEPLKQSLFLLSSQHRLLLAVDHPLVRSFSSSVHHEEAKTVIEEKVSFTTFSPPSLERRSVGLTRYLRARNRTTTLPRRENRGSHLLDRSRRRKQRRGRGFERKDALLRRTKEEKETKLKSARDFFPGRHRDERGT